MTAEFFWGTLAPTLGFVCIGWWARILWVKWRAEQ